MPDLPPSENPQSLTLPIEPKDFGNFILGLLGQRRTIERGLKGRLFQIDENWLSNLNQIIEQRIAAQNAGKLVSYSAKIFFSDGRIVILNDPVALTTFADFSRAMSVGIDISWTYLITFPLKPMPEKQDIRFRAFTNEKMASQKLKDRNVKNFIVSDSADFEDLFYSIQFSDVTWGEDLSTHIGNFIEAHSKKQSKLLGFFRSLKAQTIAVLAWY